jgi:uncharacterized membrane protein YvbJ
MNCIKCGHKNAATVTYCQRCGSKMDLTADEIAESLVDKVKDEKASSTEYYARQAVTFAAILLLVMVTLLVLSAGAPEESYRIPSSTLGAKYIEVNYKLNLELPRPKIDFEVRK